MNNYPNFYNQNRLTNNISNIPNAQTLPPQSPPLFPQPQGNVYIINSSLEVGNIPMGLGVSVALCLNENLLYIKGMNNNNEPTLISYTLTPFQNASSKSSASNQAGEPSVLERLEALEKEVSTLKTSKGGNLSELIDK